MTHRALFRFPWNPALLAVAAAALLLGGCQAMFTFSPLSSLQRPPSSMTPEQRLTYARDALASGDAAAMRSAYEAIVNDTSADAQYVAAQLGIELSGVPTVLRDCASDPSTITASLNTIDAFIASHNLDPNLMVAAAGQLYNAALGGVTLTAMDRVMGSMGLMLGFAQSTSGTWDVTTVSTADAGIARAFLSPAVTEVASLPSGDTLRTFIEDYDAYLATF